MLLIGLTGSIATGKSTVSNILRSPPYNVPIIDADVLARRVVEPETPGYNAIVSYFLPSTPDLLLADFPEDYKGDKSKGKPLDRAVLGRRVFGNDEDRIRDRKILNGITHPRVRWEVYRELVRAYVKGNWAVVLDVPLLFESGLDVICGTVLVVAVKDPEVQMRRLRERDKGLSEGDARNRVRSQGDVREKARRCEARGEGRGVVVWNDEGVAELRNKLERVMGGLKGRSPRWWAWLLLLCPPMAGWAGLWCWYRNMAINRRWKEEEVRERAKL